MVELYLIGYPCYAIGYLWYKTDDVQYPILLPTAVKCDAVLERQSWLDCGFHTIPLTTSLYQ